MQKGRLPSWNLRFDGMEPSIATAGADWNVVVTLAEEGFRDAVHMLGKWGKVKRTHYYNVLGMKVEGVDAFLVDFTAAVTATPGILNFVSHVVPLRQTFNFISVDEFEERARTIALAWVSQLEGKSFHVRLHRRGFKGMLSTPKEEQFLDRTLLNALKDTSRVTFEDPDVIIQIETIDGRAGMSPWTREEIRSYPFLGVD